MFILVIFSVILGMIMYTVYKQLNKSSKIPFQYDHAIIMGGGIGGMVSAAYLTKYFKRITIIESDDILNDTLMKSTPEEILNYRCRLESPTSLGRSGVSQIYQLHVIEGEGYKIVRELFPHLEKKLFNEYNVRTYSLKNEARLSVNGVLLNQNWPEDILWLGLDRFTFETVLRREFCLQFPNQIEWKCNTRVTQLIVDQSSNFVHGVKCRPKKNIDSTSFDLYGDFILDCTGRNSSSTKWLKEDFNLNVPTTQIQFGCGYLSFIGERFQTGNSSLDSKSVICSTVDIPQRNVGCYITPIREIKSTDKNSLRMLSKIAIHCVNSEYPPSDSYEHLLEWVKERLDENFYSILKFTKVYSPLIPYHRVASHRKYVEVLKKKWPRNFILLGDSMCTFNPQFGQGMTHACRQAKILNRIFQDNHYQLEEVSYIYNRRASTISEECWLISTANDWKTPTLKVIQTDENGQSRTDQRDDQSIVTENEQMKPPLIVRILQWYIYWFLQCANQSGQLSVDIMCVINQLNSPFILLKPTTLLKVCCKALRKN
ncbi:unnamed protein product [Adineta ricciae]|uniref:Uncharacterized protein n=2 Tax=Adineta ricciae TaxID=249248 RepID=A0A815USK9_ADIRI|nr:unnamed protein product [Adineta ricciae]CAF1520205.1 unnamed protein product [Adineta ricciae]